MITIGDGGELPDPGPAPYRGAGACDDESPMTLASFIPGPPPDEDEDEAIDARAGLDPATGLPLLLTSKCATCIYRPGNLMHLQAGRRQRMEDDAVERWSWIICHSTLPSHPLHPGWTAICRGFHDVRGQDSIGIRLALMHGGPVEVELPTTHPPSTQDTT